MKQQVEIKDELVTRLGAQGLEITKVDADKIIKAYTEILKDDLFETGDAKLPGVGILKLRYRAARVGKNPRTKEPVEIAESLSVGLSASSVIKKEIAEKVDIAPYRKLEVSKEV